VAELSSSWPLRVDPRDATPIWRQIELGIQRLVASSVLEPGAAVPSVRELAQELGVNPMTVSKAYQRLAEAGVVEVRRGEGTFVAAAPPALARGERSRVLREQAERLVSVAATLGASQAETVAELREAWARLRGKRGGEA
jgi:GntR family transcriptional regulator